METIAVTSGALGLFAASILRRCGADDAELHHDDYDDPTKIRWLCTSCHGTEHYPEATAAAEEQDRHDERLAEIAAKYAAR